MFIRTTKIILPLIPAIMLTGCTQQHLVSMETQPVEIMLNTNVPTDINNLLQIATQSQTITFVDEAQQAVGPQLVAGDFLAWQCAIAGNYFENSPFENKASMFATGPTDTE